MDGLLSLFDIHYCTQLYAFSNFHHLYKRDAISPDLGRSEEKLASLWRVELEFGRTLKLERVYLRME